MSVTLGPFAFSMTHVIFFSAVIAAFLVGWLFSRKTRQPVTDAIFRVLAVTLIVARLSFVIRYYDLYLTQPWQILNVRDGGFDFWAGLIGGAIMLLWEIMRRRKLATALVITSLIGLGIFLGLKGWQQYQYGDADFVPEVQLLTMDNRAVWLHREYRGEPLVVNLWATWCPPCVREMPLLEDAQATWPEVNFVTVNQGESVAFIENFLTEQDIQLEQMLRDPDGDLATAINNQALPTTLFFNAKGMLVDSHVGEFSAARLHNAVEKIRAEAD